jgi:hypothetical protein
MPATAYTPTTDQPITNYIPVLQTASANVARFDHNPLTFESLGLLVEEQRTNLLTYSEQFDNAAWDKSAISIYSTSISPDGLQNADALTPTNTNHRLKQNVTLSVNAVHTFSVYAKAIDAQFIGLRSVGYSTAVNVGFDLFNGTCQAGGTITPVGNGWYRCSMQFDPAGDLIGEPSIYIPTALGGFTGNVGKTALLFGAQLEAGAFPTSYIKTEASQVTRSADSASMTGANFSEWYRQDEGSFLWIGNSNVQDRTDSTQRLFSVIDSTSTYTIRPYISSGEAVQFFVSNAGNTSFISSTNSVASDSQFMCALGYSGTTGSIGLNGVLTTGTLTNLPIGGNINQLLLGAYSSSTLTGHIRKLAYYPARLTNEQLQALTS